MSLTPRQLRAIRRRRQDADADAEARFQQDVAGPLVGFADLPFLPPAAQVGWMECEQLDGGRRYCLACCPSQPTTLHVPVYQASYYATCPCLICGRRLDHPPIG